MSHHVPVLRHQLGFNVLSYLGQLELEFGLHRRKGKEDEENVL